MTRRLLVIGIGAGAPGHLTLQAIQAINRAEVFFLLDKSEAAAELVAAREAILAAHRRAPWRVARLASPKRRAEPHIHMPRIHDDGAAGTPARETTYRTDVADWHSARAALLAPLIEAELPEDGVGALLVWGDPALYDSTLRVLEAVRATLPLVLEVIPGISAVQALTSAHGLVLNEVGAKVTLTTGRRVLEDFSRDGTTVVMLDDGTGLAALIAREAEARPAGAPPLHIWWGAYLGMEGELLLSGALAQVGPEILRQRAEARAARGWIMDVWMVRGAKS